MFLFAHTILGSAGVFKLARFQTSAAVNMRSSFFWDVTRVTDLCHV